MKPVGKDTNDNITDSRQYEVEFLDGTTEFLTASPIYENLLAQVYE